MLLESKLSSVENYTIGAITGLSEVMVTNPLFVIKTKMQQGKPIPWNFSGLYKGAPANALGFMPITSIQVGVSKWMEQHCFSNGSGYKQKISSAFTAGVLSSLIACPVEMIMTLQNNDTSLSIMKAAKTQIKSQGISGLFVGQFATALRDGSFSVFFLAIPPLLKNKIKPYCPNDAIASVVSGVCSGIIASVVSHPVDTIKTTQQSYSHLKQGFFQTAQQVGPSNLFNGLLSRSSSVIVSITLMSWMREQLEQYCMEQKHTPSNRIG